LRVCSTVSLELRSGNPQDNGIGLSSAFHIPVSCLSRVSLNVLIFSHREYLGSANLINYAGRCHFCANQLPAGFRYGHFVYPHLIGYDVVGVPLTVPTILTYPAGTSDDNTNRTANTARMVLLTNLFVPSILLSP
jgi:hypothetical protein